MTGLHRESTDPIFRSIRQQAHVLRENHQHKSLWIACTESTMDRPLDRIRATYPAIFLRQLGNQVADSEDERSRELSAINYAVERLQVRDIVVCGHSLCSAIKSDTFPLSSNSCPADGKAVFRRVSNREAMNKRARDHVIQQMDVLKSYPSVRRAMDSGELRLHGLFYLVESGLFSQCDEQSQQFLPIDT
jgi:carbonic anhydrase